MSQAHQEYPFERAWSYCLWLLGRQAYTTGQLARKLGRKGASEATVARVLSKLTDLKLVDDALYAQNFVRTRSRQKGPLRLRQELFQRGVSEGLIGEALGGLEPGVQVAQAHALAEKNRWRWKGEPHEQRQKAYAFLARRGFSSETVHHVLARLFGASAGDV